MTEYALTEADNERFAQEIQNGMLPLTHALLSQHTKLVDPKLITSLEIQRIITQLYQVAHGQRRGAENKRRRRTLVGLAAPQIGEQLSIVLIDTKVREDRKRYSKLECFINPVIIWRSRESREGREGCFSTGPVWGLVRRPLALKIRAYDIHGNEVERIFEGFTARIAQHEIDHLSGVRFPERITDDKKRHWVSTEELLAYPEEIKRWPHQVALAQWGKLKTGK